MIDRSLFPTWACPECRNPIDPGLPECTPDASWACPNCEATFGVENGTWDFLTPERLASYSPFLTEYRSIRRAEGRAQSDGEYYRALPFIDLPGEMGKVWNVRARTYRAFLGWLERTSASPQRIADLGAGCAWLSNRLAEKGHNSIAIDLLLEDEDGLGSARHYSTHFARSRAEFGRLPLDQNSLDLVVFNASFHYSTCFEEALKESFRVLSPEGAVVVLDSPFFAERSAGKAMLAERSKTSQEMFGTSSESPLKEEGFLDQARCEELAGALQIKWKRIDVRQGLRWELEPWLRKFRRQRAPARFPLLIATRCGSA